jgi:fructose-bisphosphate aldolase class I
LQRIAIIHVCPVDHGVYMAGSTLKPNIVNPGKNCPVSYTVEEIAEANIFVFEQSFPVAMKGCNYLSGGQDLATAAARLSAINKANTKGPWNLVRSSRWLVSIISLLSKKNSVE